MPRLESSDVATALRRKMRAIITNKHDRFYSIYDDEGRKVCYTRISHGPRETLSSGRVNEMARQLRLDDAQSLLELVSCPLERDAALEMIKRNPPYSGRFRR